MLIRLLRSPPQFTCDKCYLRPPRRKDKKAWMQLRYKSREHLRHWEPDYGSDFASSQSFEIYFKHTQYLKTAKRGEAWLIFQRKDDVLVGSITLSNMRFGSVQSADIGYWVGVDFTRQGIMREAMDAILTRAFNHYGLHRLTAATLPENEPSRRLLEKFGFCLEGTARKYLHINGEFRDHDLYGLLEEDYCASRSSNHLKTGYSPAQPTKRGKNPGHK